MPKDLFSDSSDQYAKYRPAYPPELYDYLLSFVKTKGVAWDCATGNGQAASELSKHFQKVIASDISESQLEFAIKKPNIEYVVCPAEHTPFADNSFDLVTVAQAFHWLDWEKFSKEVTRVTKNNGVIAIWVYQNALTGEIAIDEVIHEFYRDVLGSYWDDARKHVDDGYATVEFDFDDNHTSEFDMELNWQLADLLGYISTWSAVKKFIRKNESNPLSILEEKLLKVWPPDEYKKIVFPLILKMGRIIK